MSTQSIDGLVGPSDIAELAGVSRAAVSNWRKRHDDFPQKTEGTEANPLFARRDIVTWLEENGRSIRESAPGTHIWAALNRLRDVAAPSDIAEFALLLAVMKKASSRADTGVSYRELLASTAAAFADQLRSMVDELVSIPALSGVQVSDRFVKWPRSRAVDLAEAIGGVPDAELAEAIDYCLERAQQWQLRVGAEWGFVGSPTSAILASLVPASANTVLDPACGIASALLLAARRNSTAALIGHDINVNALSVARQRAYLADIDARFTYSDVLVTDPDPQLSADIIIAEPPFDASWDPTHALFDARFKYGVPRSHSPELAWIQHVIAHLSETGHGYVITAQGPLIRGGADRKIRANLLAAGCVETIVGLPGKMLPHTSKQLALWVLRRPTPAEMVTFIDGTDLTKPEKHVARLLRHGAGDDKTTASVSVAEILADNADLTPHRWLVEDAPEPEEVLARFRDAAARVGQRLFTVTSEQRLGFRTGAVPESRTSTLKRLMEDGIVELVRGRKLDLLDTDFAGHSAELRASDVRDRRLPLLDTKPTTAGTARTRNDDQLLEVIPDYRITEPGDVLVTTMNEVRTLIDNVGGHIPSTGVDRLRITNQTVLLPGFLAAVLTGSWNERLQTGSTIKRAQIRDLEIPLVPIEAQQSIEAAYMRLQHLRDEARALERDADQLQSAILDAIRFNVPLDSNENNDANDAKDSNA